MDDIYKLLPNRSVYIFKPSGAVQVESLWTVWTVITGVGSGIIKAVVFADVHNFIPINFITTASVHAGRLGAASSESKKK